VPRPCLKRPSPAIPASNGCRICAAFATCAQRICAGDRSSEIQVALKSLNSGESVRRESDACGAPPRRAYRP
jgi:hypothetical protein